MKRYSGFPFDVFFFFLMFFVNMEKKKDSNSIFCDFSNTIALD